MEDQPSISYLHSARICKVSAISSTDASLIMGSYFSRFFIYEIAARCLQVEVNVPYFCDHCFSSNLNLKNLEKFWWQSGARYSTGYRYRDSWMKG
jgi:hypothetical protein